VRSNNINIFISSTPQKTSQSGGIGLGWANITKGLLPVGFVVIHRWGKEIDMFKKLKSFFLDFYLNLIRNSNQAEEKIFEQLDKVLVWVVGLSGGTILLVLSNYKSISEFHISYRSIKVLFLLLCTSIILGIVGRIIYAITRYYYAPLMLNFEMDLLTENVPYTPRLLSGKEKSSELFEIIKEDFEIDMSEKYLNQLKIDPSLETNFQKLALDFYKELARVSIENSESININIGKIAEQHFGKRKSRKKIHTPGRYNRINLATGFALILYILSCISFVSAFVFIVFKMNQAI
jgi:hypothetical protein